MNRQITALQSGLSCGIVKLVIRHFCN